MGGAPSSIKQPDELENPGQVLQGNVSIEGIASQLKSGRIRNVVLMVGAGISTSANIPDFRTPGTGLYSQLEDYGLPNPQAIFNIDYFKENPKPFCRLAKTMFPGNFQPTLSHYFLKLLQEKGILSRVLSQNIDGLERLADVKAPTLVECHGSFAEVHCLSCKHEIKLEEYKSKLEAGDTAICDVKLAIPPPASPGNVEQLLEHAKEAKSKYQYAILIETPGVQELIKLMKLNKDAQNAVEQAKEDHKTYAARLAAWEEGPKTRVCGGLIKPDIVFFGEDLPAAFHEHSSRKNLQQADLLIVMGTSLSVMPFAGTIANVDELCPRLLINNEAVGVFQPPETEESDMSPFNPLGNSGFRFNCQDNYRDVFLQGDCDGGIMRLCQLCGWKEELLTLQKNGLNKLTGIITTTDDRKKPPNASVTSASTLKNRRVNNINMISKPKIITVKKSSAKRHGKLLKTNKKVPPIP